MTQDKDKTSSLKGDMRQQQQEQQQLNTWLCSSTYRVWIKVHPGLSFFVWLWFNLIMYKKLSTLVIRLLIMPKLTI